MRRKTTVGEHDLIRDLKGRHLVEPPRRLLAEAIALGARLAPARKGIAGWIVELLFDSGLAPATSGVRNGAAASERRLLYRCLTDTESEAQIDLRLHAAADGTVELVGQILPPWRGGSVETRSGRARRQSRLGANVEFAVARIPGGRDTMTLEIRGTDGSSLVLDRVPMPARRRPSTSR